MRAYRLGTHRPQTGALDHRVRKRTLPALALAGAVMALLASSSGWREALGDNYTAALSDANLAVVDTWALPRSQVGVPLDVALVKEGIAVASADGEVSLIAYDRPQDDTNWSAPTETDHCQGAVPHSVATVERGNGGHVIVVWVCGPEREAYLESRSVDGVLEYVVPLWHKLPLPGPSALTPNGDELLFSSGYWVYRVTISDGVMAGSPTPSPVADAPFSALPDGSMLMLDVANGALMHVSTQGEVQTRLDLSPYRATAIATDERGASYLLAAQPTGDGTVLLRVEEDLESFTAIHRDTVGAIGPPAESSWSWAVDVAGGRVAFTTTREERFAVVDWWPSGDPGMRTMEGDWYPPIDADSATLTDSLSLAAGARGLYVLQRAKDTVYLLDEFGEKSLEIRAPSQAVDRHDSSG